MRFGPVLAGLISAALFGAATPLSKILLTELGHFSLAGLLYLGAGLAMAPFVIARRGAAAPRHKSRANLLRLGGSVLFGGALGPVFLLLGLASARASSVSLWLNLELVTTAVLGVLLFRDHLDLFGWTGVAGALVAGLLVTMGEGMAGIVPALCVALACVSWGVDNNLTSLIDGLTPQEVTMAKGLIAGAVNLGIGTLTAGTPPGALPAVSALAVGAVSYGGSIVLFIAAAQRIGAARGQVLFAAGPFFGLLFSFFFLAERPTWQQGAAAFLLAVSIVLMLRSQHAHRHAHEAVTHIHVHRHDDLHHTHAHPDLPAGVTHTHEHAHEAQDHEHPHVPDLHHRHHHHQHGS